MGFGKRSIVQGLCIAILLSHVACGYRSATNLSFEERLPISIPLIPSDGDGRLRSALARELSESGHFRYQSGLARYTLVVKIEEDGTEYVGYAWGENRSLYPTEAARRITANVSIYDAETHKDLVPPFSVDAFADYDFVNPTSLSDIEFQAPNGDTTTLLQYSLGQLDSEEGAKHEALNPLYKQLASKIVRALTQK